MLFNPEVLQITLLSLQISGAATGISLLLGLPLGTLLALGKFRGRSLLLSMVNTGMGLPPVVIGLVVYLFLSRSGPLGALNWLFTPNAMILAQVLLALARGVVRKSAATVGNFWNDIVRCILYVLLPLSLAFALVLVAHARRAAEDLLRRHHA